MNLFRVVYKTTATILMIALFFILSIAINILFYFSDFTKRRVLTKLSASLSKALLKILGFELSIKGAPPKNGTMIIGNHMSYLDILIYLSCFESLFVTSVDMRERLFLGQITSLAGCLFVERRNPRGLPKELRNIKKYFSENFSVCIFPEGTSSDGSTVLPFKNSMFQLALETKCPIQPIALKYTEIDGKAFGPKTCDLVCWYGELKFLPHILKLLSLKKIKATLEVLPQIDSNKFESRKELALYSHKILLEKYSSL